MGHTYVDLKLVNTGDEEAVRRGYLQPEQIRSTEVNALVDSGAGTLVITEHLKNQLGLSVLRRTEAEMANGAAQTVEEVGPVTIYFKNRLSVCKAVSLPGSDEVLLGVIPIEDMDVMIDPVKQELVLPPDRQYLPRVKIK